MPTSRRSLTAGALVAAAMLLPVAPASAAGGTTRYVDGDGHASSGNCNGSGHAFKHIQAAVDASGAGDTVVVCPGTYDDQVTIQGHRKGLTLTSSSPFGATIRTPKHMSSGVSIGPVLISIDRVDDVTIRGFKMVTRTHGTCDATAATIFALASKHTQIRGNRIMAPGTTQSAQCTQGYGVMIVDTLVSESAARAPSAVIGFNEIRDAVAGGIFVQGAYRAADVDIIHNSIRAYFGHAPAGTTASVVTTAARHALRDATQVKHPSGGVPASSFGIFLVLDVKGQIRDNVIQGAVDAPANGPFFVFGLFMVGAGGPPLTGLDVHDNVIRRVYWGVYSVAITGGTIRRNTLRNTVTGAQFIQSTGMTVRNNHVAAKSQGLLVNDSSGNTFAGNTVTGNGGTCQDDSTGTGTDGTANTWTGDTASQGSTPAGICPHP